MEKENNDLYAEKLKRLRINQFISQKVIATKFKITQQSYAALENGLTNFNIKKVEKICKIFKIEVDDFLTINPTNSKVKNRDMDSYNVKMLKLHYERLLILKDLRIVDLERKVKHLTKDSTISTEKIKLRVPI
jgi:transcriptional regulator with XRE-family HTH domain